MTKLTYLERLFIHRDLKEFLGYHLEAQIAEQEIQIILSEGRKIT